MAEKEKIFCVGFPKTGTSSIERALEILGYSVCAGHYENNHTNYLVSLYIHKDYQEIKRMVNYFDAFADAPWGGCDLYQFLTKEYPKAKYIITKRDSEKWYNSFVAMFTKLDSNLSTTMDTFHSLGRYGGVSFFKHIFEIESLADNKEKIIAYYDSYYEQLLSYFENGKYDYTIMDVTQSPNWDEICSFLKEPVPVADFPHANKGIYDSDAKSSKKPTLKKKMKGKAISIIKKI